MSKIFACLLLSTLLAMVVVLGLISLGPASPTHAQQTSTYNPQLRRLDLGTNPNTDTQIPTWRKFSVVKLANGSGGCGSGNGCWAVNSNASPVVAEADTSQDIVLFQKPASALVNNLLVKTGVACVGATTISFGAGVATNGVLFRAADYDLKAAVSATNYSGGIAAALLTGGTTFAAENVTARVTTTVENVSQITAGCAFDIWLLRTSLP